MNTFFHCCCSLHYTAHWQNVLVADRYQLSLELLYKFAQWFYFLSQYRTNVIMSKLLLT